MDDPAAITAILDLLRHHDQCLQTAFEGMAEAEGLCDKAKGLFGALQSPIEQSGLTH